MHRGNACIPLDLRFTTSIATACAVTGLVAGLAVALIPAASLAQDSTGNILIRHSAPGESPASEPPLVNARPDIAVQSGAVSLGTAGRLVVARQTQLARDLHASLTGAFAFEAPGAVDREAECALRQGFVRWALNGPGGRHGEVGFLLDPLSKSVQAGFEVPLPGTLSLHAFSQTRWVHNPWGDERVVQARAGLQRRFAGLLVHPEVYCVDVRTGRPLRWVGATLRLECRGAEFLWNHEDGRGKRFSARKRWGQSALRLTLGGDLRLSRSLADRHLFELGVGHGRWELMLYPGNMQSAALCTAGPFQLGFGRRPGVQQSVLGYDRLSLSLLRLDNGMREIGFGFVFRGRLRNAIRTAAGWRWLETRPATAMADPRLRWPGLATLD